LAGPPNWIAASACEVGAGVDVGDGGRPALLVPLVVELDVTVDAFITGERWGLGEGDMLMAGRESEGGRDREGGRESEGGREREGGRESGGGRESEAGEKVRADMRRAPRHASTADEIGGQAGGKSDRLGSPRQRGA
jgi:hypothetical protein